MPIRFILKEPAILVVYGKAPPQRVDVTAFIIVKSATSFEADGAGFHVAADHIGRRVTLGAKRVPTSRYCHGGSARIVP